MALLANDCILSLPDPGSHRASPEGALRPDTAIRILMLEDNPEDAQLNLDALTKSGFKVECDLTQSEGEFKERFQAGAYDVVLADYRLPGWTGLDAYRWIHSSGSSIPFILVTATLGEEQAVECVKEGITDYVLKDKLERLPIAVERALREHKVRSERDHAERILRESERQYRLLFESNPSPMWVFALSDLRFIAVNEAAVEEYGFTREEFLTMRVTDLRPGEEVPGFLTRFPRQFAGTERRGGPRRHRRKNGSVVLVNIAACDLVLGAQEARLVLAQDITAQLLAEQAVRDSREQLQLLLDSTAEAIYGLDLDGVCTFCNPAAVRMLGYESADSLLGRHMHQDIHHTRPDGSPYPKEECPIYRSSRQGLAVHVDDEVFWRPDGTSFPLEYWSHPISKDGRTMGAVVTFFDISDKRETQAALVRSEKQYRSVIEGAPYGIYSVDFDGSIRMANPALAKILGYESESEILNLGPCERFYWDPTAGERLVRLHETQDTVLDFETKFRHKRGEPLTVRLAGRTLRDACGRSYGYEVFVENITEQRLLRQQLEQAQKMEAVGQLAGGVAHDFNNLLMIIGSCAQAQEEFKNEPAQVAHYARQIIETGDRAGAVVRQLLAFSRRQILQPVILDLNAVVSDLLKMLPRFLGERVEVSMALHSGQQRIHADRGQVEQVILNLAVNARDAMPKGGKLTIETANVDWDSAHGTGHSQAMVPGLYVVLSVADTGTGMDEETRARIFDPFFTTKEPGKGTGLGLATVYGIVKQSEGFIEVDSDPGHGSTFRIYFPRVPEEAASVEAPKGAEQAVGGSETILLVEDEAVLLRLASAYLRSKGYVVLTAANAIDALKICKAGAGQIHALITDMIMPGMSGLEMANEILALHPGAAVIYMSGYADRAFDETMLGARRGFLQKPFSLNTLGRQLREALSEQTAGDDWASVRLPVGPEDKRLGRSAG